VQYRYDADGIRVSSTAAGQETRFLVDTVQPFAQVIEEYTPGGVLKVSYVHGLDLIFQNRPDTSGKSFYHVDGLGSTRALTNTSGLVTDRYIYDAFGRTIGQVGSTGNVYLFAGEQRDFNVGLDYLRARYLSPTNGRFIGRDVFRSEPTSPITLHRYTYASLNPVNYTDPSGNFTLTELSAAVTIQGILSELLFTTLLPAAATGSLVGFVWKPAFEARNLALQVISSSSDSAEINAAIDTLSEANRQIAAGASIHTLAQQVIAFGAIGQSGISALGAFYAPPSAAFRIASNSSPLTIYSGRVWRRAAGEPGPFHNFPKLFDPMILAGTRIQIKPDYVVYVRQGFIKVGSREFEGTFEIGVRPGGGGWETILHRFFRRD
jgi:RHS repeat-associated protein